jgi:hypothetical protein
MSRNKRIYICRKLTEVEQVQALAVVTAVQRDLCLRDGFVALARQWEHKLEQLKCNERLLSGALS